MKSLLYSLKLTLLGGLLFVLPVILIYTLLGKVSESPGLRSEARPRLSEF